jgi:hypothetical protein
MTNLWKRHCGKGLNAKRDQKEEAKRRDKNLKGREFFFSKTFSPNMSQKGNERKKLGPFLLLFCFYSMLIIACLLQISHLCSL